MRYTERRSSRSAGYSLVELLIAMAVVLALMGVAVTALNNAYNATAMASAVTGTNNNLRTALDLVVRDMIQVGQGLPTGRSVQVPNGVGAALIQRPHPDGSACTAWPAGTVALPAVTPGPGCGPTIAGVTTDMITVLAVDSALEGVPVNSFSLGTHTATVALPAQAVGGRDISAGGPDDVNVGDLIMFTKGDVNALAYITAIDNDQTITFAAGDPMNINQFDAALNGTVDDLANTPPTTANSARMARLRMITYYLDESLTPGRPRLVRHMNWGDPAAANNQRGRTVAFQLETLQISYDLVDGATSRTNVRMVAADLVAGGACGANPCTPNLIRKVNLGVLGRSPNRLAATNRQFRNTLSTQVSLRSLALKDRYRE
jgi:type II secretory pathway pseudopilin PulG